MRKCVFVLLYFLIALDAYSQCANAGRDTLICGYNYGLKGSPNNGNWVYLCTDSLRFIEVSPTSSSGLASVTVPECGAYQFIYLVDEINCKDADTVTIRFEDPSNQTRRFSFDISISYGGNSCPNPIVDSCNNIRRLNGANPPRPLWTIETRGICEGNYPSSIISQIDSSTCSAVVNHIGINTSDTIDFLWVSSQDAFVTTDYDSGVVRENRMTQFLRILQKGLSERLDTSDCPPFEKCFVDKGICVDSIMDTTVLIMPTHLGGRWNIINQNGRTPLNDTTDIMQDGKLYQIIIIPGARYFGPDDIFIEVYKTDVQGNISDLDSAINIIFFWEEQWIMDTLEEITIRKDPNGSCTECGKSEFIRDSIIFPDIPTTFCPTLELDFNPPIGSSITGDSALCEGRFVVLGAPEGKASYHWSNGTSSRFNFVTKPGKIILTTVDSSGCVAKDSIQVIKIDRPNYIIDGDTSMVCQGDCIEFDYKGDSITSYYWSNLARDTSTIYCINKDTIIWIEIEDIFGCFFKDSILFDIDPLFNINAGRNTMITCKQQFVMIVPDTLSLDTVSYFEWSGPGINAMNQFERTPSVSQPGKYFLHVGSGPTKCLGKDSVFVIFRDDRPMADAGTNGLINCEDVTLVLDGSGSDRGPNFTLKWEGPGIDSSNQNEIFPRISKPGKYIVFNCNDLTGCCDTDTVNIGLNINQPRADAGSDKRLSCDTMDVILGGPATSTGFDIIYEWTGPGINIMNENVKSPSVNTPGQYFLRVIDTTSRCFSIDAVQVTVLGILPVANAGADMTLTCANMLVTLNSSGSSSGSSVVLTWKGPDINTGNEHTPNPSIGLAGTYILTLSDSLSNCTDLDTVLVTNEIRLPIISAGEADTIDCDVRAIQLNGDILNDNGRMKIEWSGPGINAGNMKILRPGVTVGGIYIFKVVDTLNECTSSDTVNILELFDPAIPNAGPDLSFSCDQSSVTLLGRLTNFNPDFSIFSWEGPDIDFMKMFMLNPTVSLSGKYILSINAINDYCDVSDTMTIDYDTISPVINILGDMIFGCNEDTLRLFVDLTGIDVRSVQWSTNKGIIVGEIDENRIEIGSSGTYFIEVISENGCRTIDSVVVSQWDSFVVNIETNSTCEGEENGFARIQIQGGVFPFEFSLDGGPFVNSTFFSNLTGGDHTLEIIDKNGCGGVFDFNIVEIPNVGLEDEEFTLNLCDSDNLIIGDNFGLQDPMFIWLDDASANIKRSVQDTGVYVLMIFSECDTVEFIYTIESDILPEQSNGLFRMPNAFTPNNDLLNDKFGPVWQTERIENLDFTLFHFEIFNRWGEKIFAAENMTDMWDGIIDGNEAMPQGYFYTLEVRVMDCKETLLQFKKDGVFTLLR